MPGRINGESEKPVRLFVGDDKDASGKGGLFFSMPTEFNVPPGEWREVFTQFVYRPERYGHVPKFLVDGPDPGLNVYIDDVTLTPLHPAVRASYSAGRFQADWDGGSGPMRVMLRDNLTGKEHSFSCRPGESVSLDLQPGLYTATLESSSADWQVIRLIMVGSREEIGCQIDSVCARDTVENDNPYYAITALRRIQLEESLTKLDESQTAEATCDNIARIADTLEHLEGLRKLLKESQRGVRGIRKLRGSLEWAYWSDIEKCPQPFHLWFPEDYDPSAPWPLEVALHGYGADHMWGHRPANSIGLSVLGRSRASSYRELGEVDVYDAIAFVRRFLKVDPDRIHLTGGSMGGGGAFYIASRHPDMFASVRPLCGYAFGVDLRNLLHVPTVTVHGVDDWTVPIVGTRLPVQRLLDAGGHVLQLEVPAGLGHAAPGDERFAAQSETHAHRQVRVPRDEVRRIYYTAMDKSARGAYWATVHEWGPAGRPAIMDLRLGRDNSLHATLENVKVLEVEIAASPAFRDTELAVIVGSKLVQTVAAPLPDKLYVSQIEDRWEVSEEPPPTPAARLHYPGGPQALYQGEPLMVVWGTGGPPETRRAIYDIAQLTRKVPNPRWPDDTHAPAGPDCSLTRYGMLPGKADTEVTAKDMERYNLFLVGTAEQNTVVGELQADLPVHMTDAAVVCVDGIGWDVDKPRLSLLYHNPKAPERLIFWTGSTDKDYYTQGQLRYTSQTSPGPDLLVRNTNGIVAARRFDSRWQFEHGYADSPRLTGNKGEEATVDALRARLLCQELGIDLFVPRTHSMRYVPGVTRVMDLHAAFGYDPDWPVLWKLTGVEVTDIVERFRTRTDETSASSLPLFVPEHTATNVSPEQRYQVGGDVWRYVKTLELVPDDARFAHYSMWELLDRHYALRAR